MNKAVRDQVIALLEGIVGESDEGDTLAAIALYLENRNLEDPERSNQ